MASMFEEMGATTPSVQTECTTQPGTPGKETPRYGKYGRMPHTDLREYKKAYYTTLLFDGKLAAHLNEIDDSANTQMELITQQMAKPQGGYRNTEGSGSACLGSIIPSAAEEIVLSEFIYR